MSTLFATLFILASGGCATEADVSDDFVRRHEETSALLLEQRFSKLEDVKTFLETANVRYILEEETISKEPPINDRIAWDESHRMYYLVLLPRNADKIYRFKIYATKDDVLYLEGDFAFRNPYQ